jgi:Tfp pilus assembly protein PilF
MRPTLLLLLLLMLGACGNAVDKEAAQIAYRQGFEALASHDYMKAEQYLREAERRFPDDPYVELDLGVVYQNLGQLDKARAAYERVLDTGKGVKPRQVTDPHSAGRTLADIARENLAFMASSK